MLAAKQRVRDDELGNVEKQITIATVFNTQWWLLHNICFTHRAGLVLWESTAPA